MSLVHTPPRGVETYAEEPVQPTTSHFVSQANEDCMKPSGEVFAARETKLPPFWKANPALWFAQCECAFGLSRITADETRFRHIIVNLDPSVLPFVSDLLTNPPLTDKYLSLKTRILQTFDETIETKLRRLLRENEFRDEKPSRFLHRLRDLAGEQCSDTVLRTLFLEQLPENMRSILAISEVADLSRLAQQADKIAEVTRSSIATVENKSVSGNEEASNKDVISAIEMLTREVNRLHLAQGQWNRRTRSRSSSRRFQQFRRSSSEKFKQAEDNTFCYYHSTYGSKAHRCRSPCDWMQQQKQKQKEN